MVSMIRRSVRWALLVGGLLLAACEAGKAPRPTDQLLVGLLDDPVHYQPVSASGEPGGFEYDVLLAFAEAQHKTLRVVTAANPAALLELLARGDIDFAAAVPIQEAADVRFSMPLREARPLIVQHADALPVDDLDALANHVVEVLPGTIQEAALRQVAVSSTLTIENPRLANGLELLERVSDHRSELAASDSTHFDLAASYYPDIAIAQELPGKVTYAWAFRPQDDAMRTQANTFIAKFVEDGGLAKVHDRYFGHIKRVNPIGASQFLRDMRATLPRYRSLFQEAQTVTGIDWRLLAALGYQESKWDPLATSYTGVRGIMMLTEETADRMKVKNRLDPKESILAGARYLAELADRLPPEIREPDRLWLALAAYNLGMGHLNGARQFAVGMNKDATSWYEMKKVLPLMARPEYYQRLKSGRARGGEAVIMVENVRTYYDILARFETRQRLPLQTGLSMQ
jgi:membrane-bound lytic murein transglycosylase F